MVVNRLLPQRQTEKAASSAPGAAPQDDSDFSLDLGMSIDRATHADKASSSPAAAAAEFSSVDCSEDIELSVMAAPATTPSFQTASPESFQDDDVQSRNSVSSTLEPRPQQYPSDASTAEVGHPPILRLILKT